MTRTRQRVLEMRPIFVEIEEATRRTQHERNFAFTLARLNQGDGGHHEVAILRGRDVFHLDWDEAVAFANGWIACHFGWTFSPPKTGYKPSQSAAYRQGFADAGGDTEDLFDVAKRQFRAAERADNLLPAIAVPLPARPRPTSWAKPTDHPRPTRWERRLIVLSHKDAFGDCLIDEITSRPDCHPATIVILSPDRGYVDIKHPRAERSSPLTTEAAERMIVSEDARLQLTSLVSGGDYDDILIVAQGDYLKILDAHSDILPLCRNMERAQNSLLQRKAHIRIWLDRGHASGETQAAGHIRWSKAIHGLEAKLGEFSARYEGAAGRGLHLVTLRKSDGSIATGYVSPNGRGLDPRINISNKARLKREITFALRSFAAATRMTTRALLEQT